MRIRVIIIFLLGLLASQGFAEAYKINISMPSFSMDTIVLGHRFNASFIPKDTVILDPSGKGIFAGDEELPRGMYLVYLPDKSFFDLLIDKDQFFSFENDAAPLN